MAERLAKQVCTRGEHNVSDVTVEDCNKESQGRGQGEDSGSDYVSAESDTEDDQKIGGKNEGKDSSIISNSGIKRQTQPKNIIIPFSEESEMCTADRHNSCTFVPTHPGLPVMPSVPPSPQEKAQIAAREGKLPHTVNIGVTTPPHKPTELISGVFYEAQYLGSTFIFVHDSCEGLEWTQRAHDVIALIKQPAGERQPHFAVSLKISSENLAIINCQSNVELMCFHLCTVSFVTDIQDLLVIMVKRDSPIPGVAGDQREQVAKSKIACHVLQAPNARMLALAIGQAFNVAYHEFLRNSGINESQLHEVEYASILSAQQNPKDEIDPLLCGKTKQVTIGKKKGEMLGIMIVAAGIGSVMPTVVIAHLSKTGAAFKSGQLNVGDYLLSVNGTSLVGLSILQCIQHIKAARTDQVTKLLILPVSPVLEVTIFRPDTKFSFGFSVKEGVVCNLVRGSMADRSGVRVGYRIIQIGTNNTIRQSHDQIVHHLHTAVGQIQLKMMHLLIFKVMIGEMKPIYF